MNLLMDQIERRDGLFDGVISAINAIASAPELHAKIDALSERVNSLDNWIMTDGNR